MTKILKSGKKALSFVVAFAVIAVSLFVAIPAINLTASAAIAVTDTWDGTLSKPEDTTSNPGFVTINNAEEFAWVALSGETVSGEKYIVKANQVFDLGGMTGITPTSTAADVASATKTGQFWKAAEENAINALSFKADFDGNGLIVYNANTAAAGANGPDSVALFPYVKPTAEITIKNIKVVASNFRGYHDVGGLIGNLEYTGNINIENVEISNCSITAATGNAAFRELAGGLVARGHWAHYKINNCYVRDNIITGAKGCSGFVAAASGSVTANNTIVLGASPVSTGSAAGNAANPTCSGVYTDASVSGKAGIITNDKTAMTGKSCANLDFTATWLANDGLPELRAFHTLAGVNNGDTHSETCSRCGISGLASPHNYSVLNKAEGRTECACGAYIDGITLKWSGDIASAFASGTGESSDPYIIETPEQLAYLMKHSQNSWNGNAHTSSTTGKFYKVADGIDAFDMGGLVGITLDSDLAAVKSATATTKVWSSFNGTNFAGTFDGNGIVVYNLYGESGAMGLFPTIEGGAVIKNVKVKNSRFISTGTGAGGIFGAHNNWLTDMITIENCEVENCDLKNDVNGKVGLIGGSNNWRGVTVNNCLSRNNSITCSAAAYGGFVGESANEGSRGNVTVNNSVALGNAPCFEAGTPAANFSNVYTDSTKVAAGVTNMETLTGIELPAGLNPAIWFANNGTSPVLRLFHDIKSTANGANGHTATCADCGISALDDESHDWTANDGTCPVCGYVCDHANATDGDVLVPGDCTTNKEIAQICECGAAPNKVIPATGHEFGDIVPADPADCGNDGYKAHYICEVCDEYSLTGDAFGATVDYDTEIFEAADGNHTPLMDGEKYVYIMDDNGHSYQCSICGNPYDQHAHTGDGKVPDAQNPASGHIGECDTCGYGSGNGVLPHSFGDDNICDECAWVCADHDWKSTGVKAGDCITDETEGFECSICHSTKVATLDYADGHTFEHKEPVPAKCNADGKMAYEYCTTCNKKYADGANIKTPFENAVEDEDLIVTERPACTTNPVAAEPSDCKTNGTKAYDLCSVCGKKYINGIEITNPDDLIADLTACTTLKAIPADPATCTVDGMLAYDLCETCGKTYIDGVEKDEAALVDVHTGHKYDEYDENDVAIWKFDTKAHWHICTICGVVDKAEHKLKTDTVSYEGTYVVCEDACGYETFEHSKSDKDNVVTVTAADGVFTKDVWTTIKDIISEDIEYGEIKLLLKKENAKQFLIFDITPDEEMAKDTTAKITFKVPAEYSDNVAIIRVDVSNQTTEKLKTTLVKDEKTGDRTAFVEVDHFSVYVLADLGATTELIPEGGENEDNDPNTPPVNGDPSNTSPETGEGVAIAVIVLALVGAAFVIVRKVRKA